MSLLFVLMIPAKVAPPQDSQMLLLRDKHGSGSGSVGEEVGHGFQFTGEHPDLVLVHPPPQEAVIQDHPGLG